LNFLLKIQAFSTISQAHYEPWWSKLENTHPPIWLPVFIQSFSPGGDCGRRYSNLTQ